MSGFIGQKKVVASIIFDSVLFDDGEFSLTSNVEYAKYSLISISCYYKQKKKTAEIFKINFNSQATTAWIATSSYQIQSKLEGDRGKTLAWLEAYDKRRLARLFAAKEWDRPWVTVAEPMLLAKTKILPAPIQDWLLQNGGLVLTAKEIKAIVFDAMKDLK